MISKFRDIKIFSPPYYPLIALSFQEAQTPLSSFSLPTCAISLRIVALQFTDTFSTLNSTIRQVPDHQEVYLATNGFTSLIIDLGERVTETSTDEEALLFHWNDIKDSQDEAVFLSRCDEDIDLPHLP